MHDLISYSIIQKVNYIFFILQDFILLYLNVGIQEFSILYVPSDKRKSGIFKTTTDVCACINGTGYTFCCLAKPLASLRMSRPYLFYFN